MIVGLVTSAIAFLPDHSFEEKYRRHLDINGLQREYFIYTPTNLADTNHSAVIVFHGGGENAEYMAKVTGWRHKAEEQGFLVIFPEGTRPNPTEPAGFRYNQQAWQDGTNRFPHHAQQGVDDLAFVEKLIEILINDYSVDPDRVFATGFSNGAALTLRLGLELSEKISAIAPVAGGLWHNDLKLQSPVSLIYISGTDDALPGPTRVSQEKGEVVVPPPASNLTEVWAGLLNCRSQNVADSGFRNVNLVAWDNCLDDSRIQAYSIKGLGHKWPNTGDQLNFDSEKSVSDFSATDVIWQFFSTTK